MTDAQQGIGRHLNAMLAEAGQPPLDTEARRQFETYYKVLQRWNQRVSLTAIRTESEILRRHFVESIAVARALPPGLRTLLDFGSGAGFPGVPIAICRPEIAVVLAESQAKKAAFLNEVARATGARVEVYRGRAESIVRKFDCVTLRAVDRMQEAVTAASALVGAGGLLALLTTGAAVASLAGSAGPGFAWQEPVALPSADARILSLGRKRA